MMMSRLFSLLAFLLLGVMPARALNLVVTSSGDSGPGTLRQAVETANGAAGDDVITFTLSGDQPTVDLSSELTVTGTDRLTITAEGLSTRVTLSPLGASRIFKVNAGATLELIDLVLADGFAPSGGEGLDGDTPTKGADGEHGGAIYNDGGILKIRECYLSANLAGFGGRGGNKESVVNPGLASGGGGKGGKGGAIYSSGAGAEVWIEDSAITGNEAGTGGFAGSLVSGASGSIGDAGEGGAGGAIFCEGGYLSIRNVFIGDNRAGRGGGGGEHENGGTGGAGGKGGYGGAVACVNTVIEISDSTIETNSAGDGGAGGDVFGDSTDVRGAGGAGGDGGGLWASGLPDSLVPHVATSLFHQNRAGNGWTGGSSEETTGGDSGTPGGAGGSGGGIFLSGADGAVIKIVNSTLLRNDAGEGGAGGSGSNNGTGGNGGNAGNGGGIALWRAGVDYSIELIHVSVLANAAVGPGAGGLPSGSTAGSASSGGGIWEVAGGIKTVNGPGLSLANTVVASNNGGSVADVANFTSLGSNFTSGDPEVDALADNGGPTLTVAPLQGSPLLDEGGDLADEPVTDQRGEPRPFNGVPDIGAFEAKLQPDARIGTTSNPATHRIDNVYTPTGAGQTIAVRTAGAARRLFYFSLQNDGEISDDLTLHGTKGNATVVANVYRLTGGRVNVTSQLVTGSLLAGIEPGETLLYQVEVKARSKKKRAKQVLAYRVNSSITTMRDAVQASVIGSKPKKKKS